MNQFLNHTFAISIIYRRDTTVLYLLFILASLSHLFRVQGYPCCKVCHEKTQTGVDIAFKVPNQLIASLFRFIHLL